jgi:hypothetical protein
MCECKQIIVVDQIDSIEYVFSRTSMEDTRKSLRKKQSARRVLLDNALSRDRYIILQIAFDFNFNFNLLRLPKRTTLLNVAKQYLDTTIPPSETLALMTGAHVALLQDHHPAPTPHEVTIHHGGADVPFGAPEVHQSQRCHSKTSSKRA